MKDINVIIQGESNSGKTVIARKIQIVLNEYGIQSEINDQDFESNEDINKLFTNERVENVIKDFGNKEKIKVNIRTQNLNRKDLIS